MSGEGGDSQDKSHAPTQRKLEKSREQGDVAYSTEITTAATYGALYLAIIIAGGMVATNIGSILLSFFAHPDVIAAELMSSNGRQFMLSLLVKLFVAVTPIFAPLAIATILSLVAQRAVVFAPTKIKPKLNRLSIIDNAKNKYGPNGLGEFVKSMTKMSVTICILLFAFKDRFLELPFLAALPVQAFGPTMYREAVFFLGLTTAAAVAVAAADFPWKKFMHEKKLRMSFEELKKENKETEGDPFMKNERKKRAQEIATNRMLSDVPDANVVIVNPTHYAVALKWSQDAPGAPVCIAKGVDEVAARIREVASEAGVPISRDPPTARSIYALVEIGEEIQREHFAAVAAAIHYADEVRKKATKGYSNESQDN